MAKQNNLQAPIWRSACQNLLASVHDMKFCLRKLRNAWLNLDTWGITPFWTGIFSESGKTRQSTGSYLAVCLSKVAASAPGVSLKVAFSLWQWYALHLFATSLVFTPKHLSTSPFRSFEIRFIHLWHAIYFGDPRPRVKTSLPSIIFKAN